MKTQKRIRERGIAIYVTTVILVMAVPMIGLAIDSTLLYIVKSRLQGAVDGAALAAAKGLSRGADGSAQIDAATTAAATYVKLNYPSNYFFSNEVVVDTAPGKDVVIDTSVARQRRITVTGHITQPTLFMRYLNYTSTNINASATTVRTDANIVLVLDRSGSMSRSSSCAPMKAAANNFINTFAETRDYIGLVTFSTSAYANVPIETTSFKSKTAAVLNSLVCDGSTSSAAGLWLAYDQLVGLNQPAALNYIVFFTDGEPTGAVVNMPVYEKAPAPAPNSPCSAALRSTILSVPRGLPAGYVGRYITGLYATYVDGSAFIGLANQDPQLKADGITQDFSSGTDNFVSQNSANCTYAAGWNNAWTNFSDFRGIPPTDIYGNSLDTTYEPVTKIAGPYIDLGDHTNGIKMATNAADDAANRIRHAAIDDMVHLPIGAAAPIPPYNRGLTGIIIDSVGLGNASVPLPADGTFLKRVSNDPNCTPSCTGIYDSNYPTGLFVWAATSSDINGALQVIAAEILRIAR